MKLICKFIILILVGLISGSSVSNETLDTTTEKVRRILNGRIVTDKFKYPFVVVIQVKRAGKISNHCGGSIINKNWIITAAHCVDVLERDPNTDLQIHAGSLKSFNYENSQVVKIKEYVKHPNYTRRPIKNDIALIKLATPLQFSFTVDSIDLPYKDYLVKKRGMIIGWGAINNFENNYPDDLMEAGTGVDDITRCEKFFSIMNPRTELCLGVSYNTNACAGDSGGPFIQYEFGRPLLVGLTSYGAFGCFENKPIVYTRVSAYYDFIQETIS